MYVFAEGSGGGVAFYGMSATKTRWCRRRDLGGFRGLSDCERAGFLLVLEWFENFRLRAELDAGREAARAFWRLEVLREGVKREAWQLEQWEQPIRLRVKDVDLDRGTVTVRLGKGDKDRMTVLPKSLIGEVASQLEEVREIWRGDRDDGLAGMYLPGALARKYRRAAESFEWFWLFPARQTSIDPATRTGTRIVGLHLSSPRRAGILLHRIRSRRAGFASVVLDRISARRTSPRTSIQRVGIAAILETCSSNSFRKSSPRRGDSRL